MTVFSIKRGATLLLNAAMTNDDGTPIDITGAQITSQLRDATGAVVSSLAATVLSASSGLFQLSAASAVTASWPAGQLSCDICAVQAGGVLYSQTFILSVTGAVTSPPGGAP